MKRLSLNLSVIVIVLFISFSCISCSPIQMAVFGLDVGLKVLSSDSSSSNQEKEYTGSRHWDPGRKKYYHYDERGRRIY